MRTCWTSRASRKRWKSRAANAIELPTGRSFYRRWQVQAVKGAAAIDLRFSFVPGFAEYNIHVRGSLAAATADIERNTYTLDRYRPADPDFENYAMLVSRAKSLKAQARRTLRQVCAVEAASRKARHALRREHRAGNGRVLCGAMDGDARNLDARISGDFGARVIRRVRADGQRWRSCRRRRVRAAPVAGPNENRDARILVLGGAGFIGKELVRQLVASGRGVRLLVRSAASLPEALRAQVDCQTGDLLNRETLLRAMEGVECVVHLARSNVKTWADYQKFEIEATRKVAECALEAGVKRFIYAGTIDSYYAGRRAGDDYRSHAARPRTSRAGIFMPAPRRPRKSF